MTSKAIKLGPYLKEIRIHLCQKSNESSGIRVKYFGVQLIKYGLSYEGSSDFRTLSMRKKRDFIRKHYVPIKKQNPAFPILIRECEGVEPKIYARYDFGKEASVSLSNHQSDQVLEVVKKLASTSKN